MGIYGVAAACGCTGSWCTWTDDHRVIAKKRCDAHELRVGNTILYMLSYVLGRVAVAGVTFYAAPYEAKVVEVVKREDGKQVVKLAVKGVDVTQLAPSKCILFGDMRDEPMWAEVGDDGVVHVIVLYNHYHHTVDQWEAADY
jgi:hypothetical protein